MKEYFLSLLNTPYLPQYRFIFIITFLVIFISFINIKVEKNFDYIGSIFTGEIIFFIFLIFGLFQNLKEPIAFFFAGEFVVLLLTMLAIILTLCIFFLFNILKKVIMLL